MLATLCNSAAVLPAGLTLILAVQIRSDLGISPFRSGLGFTVYSAGIALFSTTRSNRGLVPARSTEVDSRAMGLLRLPGAL